MSHCIYPTIYESLCFSIEINKRLTHTCHAKQWPTPPSILNMPDETLTMHLLWQTLAISNCSVYVKSCNSTGLSPIQRSFAIARVNILFLSETLHIQDTLCCNEMLRQVLSILSLYLNF